MSPFPNKFWPFCTKYARLFKKQLILTFVLMTCAAVFDNLVTRCFSEVVGTIKINNTESYTEAIRLVWILAIVGLLHSVVDRYSRYYSSSHLNIALQAKMEEDLFSYLLGHSYEYVTNRQSGVFIQQKDQVKILPEMLHHLFYILRGGLDLTVKVVMLAIISPFIGGLYMLAIVGVILPSHFFKNNIIRANKLNAKISEITNGRVLDVINNLSLVKQFDGLDEEKKNLHPLFKQQHDMSIKALTVFFSQFTTIGLLISFASFLILLLTIYLWTKSTIGTADLVFVIMTLHRGLGRVQMIMDSLQRVQQDVAMVEKGLEPFATVHGIVDDANAKALKAGNGKIEFINVSFKYKNKRKKVFDKFNLVINAKEKVGIVGESGSGKTTLINLLQRAFEINEGEILINGQNIAKVTQSSLHQAISLIPQDTVMFNRNIFDNIAFGVDGTDLKKVKYAAQKAFADDFIKEKENGYFEFAGDRGCKLSGGERQRIAIARAILKKSPILILDEATSALDSESEVLINKALDNAIKNQTVIAIAHRLSTLKNMDRILVLDKGKIVEDGNFEELIKKGGKFAKLYKAQQIKEKKNA